MFGERLFDFYGRENVGYDTAKVLDDITRLMEEAGYGEYSSKLSSSVGDSYDIIKNILISDAQSIFENDPAANSVDEVIYCYPGFFAIFCHRIAHIFYECEIPMLPRLISEYAHSMTGIDIHPGAQIGEGFSIDHGTGIVIGETAQIGKGVSVYQGVTIGAKTIPHNRKLPCGKSEKRHPTVKDGCRIYANALVLGRDTVIGENSVIGAGVRVTHTVPENTVLTYTKQKNNSE